MVGYKTCIAISITSWLIELGVDRFVLRGSPLDPADPDSMASERFTQEVIRQLRN